MTTQAELIELFAIHPDTPKIRAHGNSASIAHEPDSQATAIAICVQLLNPKDKMPAGKWLWLQVQPVDALKLLHPFCRTALASRLETASKPFSVSPKRSIGTKHKEALAMADISAPQFTNEDAAIAHLEASRWPDGVNCPHCGSVNVHRMAGETQAGISCATIAATSSRPAPAPSWSARISRFISGCWRSTC